MTNKTTQRTPGPWEVYMGRKITEALANARLIAAAPEQNASLMKIREVVRSGDSYEQIGRWVEGYMLSGGGAAAIAKASGEGA